MTTGSGLDRKRDPVTWPDKALIVGVALPLGVIALANPAAAQPEALDAHDADSLQDYETPSGESPFIDFVAESPTHDIFDDLAERDADGQPYGPQPDDGTGFSVHSHGESSTAPDADRFTSNTPAAGSNLLADAAVTTRRDFFIPDHADQPNPEGDGFHEHAVVVLETLGVAPERAYTLEPGRHGWTTGLDSAKALDELGLAHKADNLRHYLDEGQFTGFFGRPAGQPAGLTAGSQAAVDTSIDTIDLLEMVAHESTHIDQYESASPIDEIEAYATGALVRNWAADTPEDLEDSVMASSRRLERNYPAFRIFRPVDTQSAIAAKAADLLPENLPYDWAQAKTGLRAKVMNQTINEKQIRSVIGFSEKEPINFEIQPDGSAHVENQGGQDVTLKINTNGSWTLGYYDRKTNTTNDRDYYDGRLIEATIFYHDTGVTITESQLHGWSNTVQKNGTRAHTQHVDGQPSYVVTVDPNGEFRLDFKK